LCSEPVRKNKAVKRIYRIVKKRDWVIHPAEHEIPDVVAQEHNGNYKTQSHQDRFNPVALDDDIAEQLSS
jgi:hypothetical protein